MRPTSLLRLMIASLFTVLLAIQTGCGGGGGDPAGGNGGGNGSPGFTLTLNPGSLSIPLPASGNATTNSAVQVVPSNGFTGTVNFSLQGAPQGVSATFTPAASATATSLQLSVASTVPAGNYPLAIKGSASGAPDASVNLNLGLTGAPPPATPEVVLAVENAARTIMAQSIPKLDQLQAIVAFMGTRSEYQATGIDEGSLSAWGLLKNGKLHIVTNNRDPHPAPVQTPPPVILPAAAGASVSPSSFARLFHSFGGGFEGQDPINDVSGWLKSAGWSVRSGIEGDARVATLRGVSGDGFFYINCHGGRVDVTTAAGTELVYALQSSTLVDENLEKIPEYADDLASHRLAYFTAKNGETKTILGISYPDFDTRYAITAAFVDKYWSFAKDSIVFVNACYSGRNAEFIFACQKKGAGVYLGWSEKLSAVAAYPNVRYFVDRCLGANQYQPENPKQRAFPWNLVLDDMKAKGLATDAATGGLLQGSAASSSSEPPILAPSIRLLVVNDGEAELKLLGYFGSNQGKVTVDGTEIHVKSWAPDEILCDNLPLTASGDVQVQVRDLKSNLRQLTEWKVPFKYTWSNYTDIPALKFEGSTTLRFRLDVGSFRKKPGTDPVYLIRGTYPTKDSGMTVTGSGSGKAHPNDCISTLAGSGYYPCWAPNSGTIPDLIFGALMRVDSKGKLGVMGLAFGAKSPDTMPHTITLSGREGCTGSHKTTPVFGLLEQIANIPFTQEENAIEASLPAINFTFGTEYQLNPPAGGAYTDTRMTGSLKIEWTLAIPKAPPKSDAAR